MRRRSPGIRVPVLVSVLLLAAVVALPAAARQPSPPTVDVHSLGVMAPDAHSIHVQVLASCGERATVVEAVVAVSQPSGSGRAPIPLTCAGFVQVFNVVVPVENGVFTLGTAEVTATVVSARGKTLSASDTEAVSIDPGVNVELGDSARLGAGGASVALNVTVACPAGTTGVPSSVGVFQVLTSGSGPYLPVCDGHPHTFAVTVTARQGAYVAGIAQALTFADIVWEGRSFSGVDDDGALDLVP
jgi:hypothetical protein